MRDLMREFEQRFQKEFMEFMAKQETPINLDEEMDRIVHGSQRTTAGPHDDPKVEVLSAKAQLGIDHLMEGRLNDHEVAAVIVFEFDRSRNTIRFGTAAAGHLTKYETMSFEVLRRRLNQFLLHIGPIDKEIGGGEGGGYSGGGYSAAP
jgi:hypothetical protein